jgi:hypothetical protein
MVWKSKIMMTSSKRNRYLASSILAAFLFCLVAGAQEPAPNTTEWENETLKLRLFYPSDMVKGDPSEVIREGQINLPGLTGIGDSKSAEAARCLRPALVLQLPHSSPIQKAQPTEDGATQITVTPAVNATILLAELDLNCLNAERAAKSTTLLDDMAEIVNKAAGMKSIAEPSTYTIGWQKVHMAAAQGQQGAAPVYTMGLSTNWNNHLLLWYFSSSSIETLNRITKTTVRFGNDHAAPLYPVTVGNSSQ